MSAGLYLRQQLTTGSTPGVSYAFFNTASVIYSHTAGLADVAAQTPLTPGHTFNAYSATKTVTALAILQLVQQGRLDMDKPVREYLPDFPYHPATTTRHLLNHTAGIPGPVPLSWIHLYSEHDSFDGRRFFMQLMAKHPKPAFAPGSKFMYSNMGYVLLGWLLEALSGMPYQACIEKNILLQAGAGSGIGFAINPALQCKGYIQRYSWLNLLLGLFINKHKYMAAPEGRWRPFKNIYMNGAPYGGLLGNAAGFTKYLQCLLLDNSPLLNQHYRQLLFTENIINGKPTGMCLGWYTGLLNGHRYVCHAGGGGGYYCEVRLYPQLQKGSVIFFNRTGIRDERLLDKVDTEFI